VNPVSPNLRDGDTGFTCAYPFATVVSERKVLCVYRRGREKHSDDGVLLMQHSFDNGRTWSESATVFDGRGLTPPQVAVTGTIGTSGLGGVVSTIGVVDVTRPGVYLFSEEGLLQMWDVMSSQVLGAPVAGVTAATPADREAFTGFVRWLCAELKPHGITALLEPFDTTIDKKFLYGSTADCVALLDSLALETSNLGIELDLAHVPLMGESSEHAIRTVAPYLALGMYGRRAVPLARVRENDVLAIRQVLDMGAQGVIVPLVNSAEEAAQAVRAARYPPAGIRGYAFSRMNEWGREFDAYAAKANDAVAVVVMIESKEGAEHIDAILDVEGVDGVFIGPYDLSGSFNVPGQTEAAPVRKACRRVLDACANAGKSAGIHVVIPTPKAIASAIEDGFTFLALGVDTVFLGGGARDASAISKRRLIPVRIGPRCCARWP